MESRFPMQFEAKPQELHVDTARRLDRCTRTSRSSLPRSWHPAFHWRFDRKFFSWRNSIDHGCRCVCGLTESQVVPFVSRFNADFYVSQTAVENAVRNKSCFNLIHLPTAFKVDVFVSRGHPFDNDSMRRATQEKIGTTRTLEVPMATAEDSIVSKLEWYRLTEETSERQ